MIVAPNSPSERAQPSTVPAITPGSASGTVTRRKVVQRVAPSVAAASSNRGSAERSAPSIAITTKGIETKTCASTTPYVVKGKAKPVQSSSGSPITPVRPKALRRATPATTGGSTSGTVTSARSAPRPRKSTRASSQASGRPRRRQKTIAIVEVTSESRSASSATREVRWPGRSAQLVLATIATSGTSEEQRGERRRHHQQCGRPPQSIAPGPVPHGLPKPASSRIARPSSDVTHATQSAARSASSDCSSVVA